MYKPRSIRKYANIAWFIKQGQQRGYLRNEPQDHPCNATPVPEEVSLYIAEVRGGKTGQIDRFRAYFEANGQQQEVQSGKTRTEVLRNLAFDFGYSMYANSCYYRLFRSCFGFSEHSTPYQTVEKRQESERRSIGAIAIMAGVSPEAISV
jgi:hypothetical protein